MHIFSAVTGSRKIATHGEREQLDLHNEILVGCDGVISG